MGHAPHAVRSTSAPPTAPTNFRADVLSGLRRPKKFLPCQYFYDERGSALFDRICELAVYYPTRTEIDIMRRHAREMSALLGEGAVLVELGSGSSLKTRILLDHAPGLAAYVPVDISRSYLEAAARSLLARYPRLSILPVLADYTRPFALPRTIREAQRVVAYYPGSTIGNFQPQDAGRFLRLIAGFAGNRGGLLIGVDLKKDSAVIEAAYNDPEGVTAAFNKNLLHRINRELGANFDVDHFHHRAFYDAGQGRIEMQLESDRRAVVEIAGERFQFEAGEAVTTEYSYKYDLAEFARLARGAGFDVRRTWMDEARLFSVQYLTLG
jgi:L-histidine Nalpha-methyltransferase